MFVCCECCVLCWYWCVVLVCAGTGVRSGPITRTEETYRVCVHARMSLSAIGCNDKLLHVHRVGMSSN